MRVSALVRLNIFSTLASILPVQSFLLVNFLPFRLIQINFPVSYLRLPAPIFKRTYLLTRLPKTQAGNFTATFRSPGSVCRAIEEQIELSLALEELS